MIRAPARPVPVAELVRLGLYWFATSFHWGALLTVLIPAEILRFVPESQKGAYLGGLFAAGAVLAMVASPISGALSDRSTLPMGRRRPFVLAGALINCLGLVGMRYAPTYLAYSGSYMFVQAANNFAGGAFNGLIPDKVPQDQRGTASGIMGFMMLLGTISGALVSGTLVGRGHPAAVYWIVAGVLAAGAAIMAYGVTERPLPAAPRVSWSAFLRSFWIDPRRYPDFGWMFATRALVMMGFYTLISFLQFFLKDTLHLTPPQAAQTTGALSAVTIAAGAGVSLLAGWISDRVGRRGIISLAGIFLAFTGAGLLFRPPLSALLWIAVLFGLGYGAFTSVDWALAIDVLPADGSPAKDLGIWAIANTLPQIVAPLTAGPVLDAVNQHSANLGYTVIFGAAIVYVILGSILVWKIKGAR